MNDFETNNYNEFSYYVDRIKVHIDEDISQDILEYAMQSLCNNNLKILTDKIADDVGDALNWRTFNDYEDLSTVLIVDRQRMFQRDAQMRFMSKLEALFGDLSLNRIIEGVDSVLWKTPITEISKKESDKGDISFDITFDITPLELCYQLAEKFPIKQTLSYDNKDKYDILYRILEKDARGDSIVQDIKDYLTEHSSIRKDTEALESFEYMIRYENISNVKDEVMQKILSEYERATICVLNLEDLLKQSNTMKDKSEEKDDFEERDDR